MSSLAKDLIIHFKSLSIKKEKRDHLDPLPLEMREKDFKEYHLSHHRADFILNGLN